MRRILFILLLFCAYSGITQNKQLLYDFESVPQHSLLNPGGVMEQKFFIGVPFLSQLAFDGGLTLFSAYDLFADDGVNINEKLRNVVEGYGNTEIFSAHQQLEILSGGFRMKNHAMLTFGVYQEANTLIKVPKDIIHLSYYGNSEMDRHYSLNKANAFGELLNVFHVGYNFKKSDNLIIGGRFKIYSSAFHASSSGATGSIITREGTVNLLAHHIDNVNIAVNTSGIPFDDSEDVEPNDVVNRLILGGNLGFGVDVGFTKYLSDQLKVTGSILDFGFVSYSKEVKNFEIKGNYIFEGAELLYADDPMDYWDYYSQELKGAVENSENADSYLKLRPLKLNAGIHYSFGMKRDYTCNYLPKSQRYLNKLSAHLFTLLSDVHTRIAGTVSFERYFSKHFQAKVSYTADSFSFSNIGLGMATQLGPVQFYFLADNLLNLTNVYDAQAFALQLGINFNFYDLN